MADLFEQLKREVAAHKPAIVFPESGEARVAEAVRRLAEEDIVRPILIARPEQLSAALADFAGQGKLIVRDPAQDRHIEQLAAALVERRSGKVDHLRAVEMLQDPCCYGTMLVYLNEADGLVSGAIHSTAATVRPALQLIKPRRGRQRISGAFLMVKGDERLWFADCGINMTPDAVTLAEITAESAEEARLFGIEPRIAMLSFSTKGSAAGAEIDKVTDALAIVRREHPELCIDGELQFDAAYVPEVGAKKAPGSPVAGRANVFIFPNLDAGNIAYKMVQRLGGYTAIGPILQGLNRPVNDLSRGCTADDVYKLALITGKQALSANARL
ncbi:MAG: phosphate acetyltransferase [Sporolactobacillus sp.]